jgi:YHS domain-containing protein
MMSFLIRVLIFLIVLWLIRRWIASLIARRAGQGGAFAGRERAGIASNTVKDPVCGMYMDPRLAVKIQNRNGCFYFCSEECRKKFLSA